MKFRNINPLVRAVGVFGAVSAIAIGATYALGLTSQATLQDNTISTATADLKLWDGAAFNTTAPGFTITDLIPGTPQTFPFYFQNSGAADLNLTAHVTNTPTLSGFVNNSDLSQVQVTITNDFGVGSNTVTDLNQLVNGAPVPLNGGVLHAHTQGDGGTPGTEGNFHATFNIPEAAINSGHAEVSAFDLQFTGTQP